MSSNMTGDLADSHLTRHVNIALAMRYLTMIGLAMLLQDHALTFRSEVALVWRAPPSFGKYAFILNRYLVPASLVAAVVVISGFSGTSIADTICQRMTFAVTLLSMLSLGLANLLVLLRVCALWDGSLIAVRLLAFGYLASFGASLSSILVAIIRILPGVIFNKILHQCVSTRASPFMIAAWAAPLAFEMLVLGSMIWNALSRPRDAEVPLTRALREDGMAFFLGLTLLRGLITALAASLDPGLSVCALFFVWALVTITLNRALLRLRGVEEKANVLFRVKPRGHHNRSSTTSVNPEGSMWEQGRATPMRLFRSETSTSAKDGRPHSTEPTVYVDIEATRWEDQNDKASAAAKRITAGRWKS